MVKIKRNNENKNFTILGNEFLQDKEISLKLKGLLALILSLPESWNLSMKSLLSIVPDGQTSINTTFKEGIKFGYIDMIKTNKGKFEVEYSVSYKREFKRKKDLKIDNVADANYIIDHYFKKAKKGNRKKALEVLHGAFGKKGVIYGNKARLIESINDYFTLKIDFKYRKSVENFLSSGYWEQDFLKDQEEKEDKSIIHDYEDYKKYYNSYLRRIEKTEPMGNGIFKLIISKTEGTLSYDDFKSVWKWKKEGLWSELAEKLFIYDQDNYQNMEL